MLGRTPSQTVGPYYAIGLDRRPANELVDVGSPGAVVVRGVLVDGQDEPISDGLVELWSSAAAAWGRSGTTPGGEFSFVVAKPPALGTSAPHYEVVVFARGLLRHQLTRLYFPDEPAANAADPLLASLPDADRATLVAQPATDGLRFDIRMQGEHQTIFFAH